jgi:hypothetical protein
VALNGPTLEVPQWELRGCSVDGLRAVLVAMDMAPPRTALVAASRRTRRRGRGAKDGSCGGACGEGEGGAVESSISMVRWSCVCYDAAAVVT